MRGEFTRRFSDCDRSISVDISMGCGRAARVNSRHSQLSDAAVVTKLSRVENVQ